MFSFCGFFHNNQHQFSSSSNLFYTLFLSFGSLNGIHTIQDFVLGFGFFSSNFCFYHLGLLFVVLVFLVYNKISCLPLIICNFFLLQSTSFLFLNCPWILKLTMSSHNLHCFVNWCVATNGFFCNKCYKLVPLQTQCHSTSWASIQVYFYTYYIAWALTFIFFEYVVTWIG